MNTSIGPLAGKRILVTRPKEQAVPLISLIQECGGLPLSFPIVSIKGVKDEEAQSLLSDLPSYQWIIFTSKNGVDHFFQLISDCNLTLGNVKFAAVGEKTAESLRKKGITSILVPDQYHAESLVKTLKKHVLSHEKILFPKGNLAPSFIKEELKETAWVEELVVYKTESEDHLDWSLVHQADCLFFMSPSAVTFMSRGLQTEEVYKKPVICVGPTTKKAAEECGYHHVLMPKQFTAEDMVNCAISYFQGGS
ncbi:uroporphyrinogen-III synthase [Fictibacillus phosphorivorans]|uniref:uroporphyrinogen-III synthase n=1 Tax=Fictibacillus phosphorivorans TaxID=1221500 RepID=UPI0012934835|nr:uroporphyrinogen-III synthase [Fictibacillus phosphorivorans]MQR95392.1 uroporphyrinogen-III synthase [Fictibacillus phosphorivorans]